MTISMEDEFEGTFEPNEAWSPSTVEEADWCLKRIGELNAQMEENRRITAAYQFRLESLNKRLEKDVEYFTGHVKQYANAHKDELLGSGRKKSRDLPHGTISFRKTREGLEVKDSEALAAWVADKPGCARVTVSPLISVIQEWYKKTGEIPPGTEVKEVKDEVSISTVEVTNE